MDYAEVKILMCKCAEIFAKDFRICYNKFILTERK